MNDRDLVRFCQENRNYLDEKKRKFVDDVFSLRRRGGTVTVLMHQYLQSCYDEIVNKRFNLDDQVGDTKETIAQRAINKNRR